MKGSFCMVCRQLVQSAVARRSVCECESSKARCMVVMYGCLFTYVAPQGPSPRQGNLSAHTASTSILNTTSQANNSAQVQLRIPQHGSIALAEARHHQNAQRMSLSTVARLFSLEPSLEIVFQDPWPAAQGSHCPRLFWPRPAALEHA
jgi:hypothetical protein